MKILKSIWKSKEAPKDENFLWLKFEEGTFNLYTKGQTGWEIIKGVPVEQLQGYTLYSGEICNLDQLPSKPTDGNKYFIIAAESTKRNFAQYTRYLLFTSDPETANGNWDVKASMHIQYAEYETEVKRNNFIGPLPSQQYVEEINFLLSETGTFTEAQFRSKIRTDKPANYYPSTVVDLLRRFVNDGTWHCPITFKCPNAGMQPSFSVIQKVYKSEYNWNFKAIKINDDNSVDILTVGQEAQDSFIIKYTPYNPIITLADSFSNFSMQTKANAASQLGITEDELDAIVEGSAIVKKGNYTMRLSKREIVSQTNVICTYSSVGIDIYSTTLSIESSFFCLSKEGNYYNAIYNSGTSTVAKS